MVSPSRGLLATNGASQDAPRFPALTGYWQAPGAIPVELRAGIVGGHFNVHSSPAFSPDGREIYWSESFRREDRLQQRRTMMSGARAIDGRIPARMVGRFRSKTCR